jgi:hypothetical protein
VLTDVEFRVRVTWSDGSASEHLVSLDDAWDDLDLESLAETLGHKLADFLMDPWPTDTHGLPLGWFDVEVLE